MYVTNADLISLNLNKLNLHIYRGYDEFQGEKSANSVQKRVSKLVVTNTNIYNYINTIVKYIKAHCIVKILETC